MGFLMCSIFGTPGSFKETGLIRVVFWSARDNACAQEPLRKSATLRHLWMKLAPPGRQWMLGMGGWATYCPTQALNPETIARWIPNCWMSTFHSVAQAISNPNLFWWAGSKVCSSLRSTGNINCDRLTLNGRNLTNRNSKLVCVWQLVRQIHQPNSLY